MGEDKPDWLKDELDEDGFNRVIEHGKPILGTGAPRPNNDDE